MIDLTVPDEELFGFHTQQIQEIGVHLDGWRLYETMGPKPTGSFGEPSDALAAEKHISAPATVPVGSAAELSGPARPTSVAPGRSSGRPRRTHALRSIIGAGQWRLVHVHSNAHPDEGPCLASVSDRLQQSAGMVESCSCWKVSRGQRLVPR